MIALREMEEQRWTMDAAAQETWRSSLDAATRKEVSGALTRAETIFKSAAPAEKNAYAEQLAALIAQGEQKQMAEKRTVEEWAMSVTRSATEAKSNAETALKVRAFVGPRGGRKRGGALAPGSLSLTESHDLPFAHHHTGARVTSA